MRDEEIDGPVFPAILEGDENAKAPFEIKLWPDQLRVLAYYAKFHKYTYRAFGEESIDMYLRFRSKAHDRKFSFLYEEAPTDSKVLSIRITRSKVLKAKAWGKYDKISCRAIGYCMAQLYFYHLLREGEFKRAWPRTRIKIKDLYPNRFCLSSPKSTENLEEYLRSEEVQEEELAERWMSFIGEK